MSVNSVSTIQEINKCNWFLQIHSNYINYVSDKCPLHEHPDVTNKAAHPLIGRRKIHELPFAKVLQFLLRITVTKVTAHALTCVVYDQIDIWM
jgi:hypothetical protein